MVDGGGAVSGMDLGARNRNHHHPPSASTANVAATSKLREGEEDGNLPDIMMLLGGNHAAVNGRTHGLFRLRA